MFGGDGKTPKDTRTPEQKDSLLELLRVLRKMYPDAKIHSHRDFAAKACPSFDAGTFTVCCVTELCKNLGPFCAVNRLR